MFVEFAAQWFVVQEQEAALGLDLVYTASQVTSLRSQIAQSHRVGASLFFLQECDHDLYKIISLTINILYTAHTVVNKTLLGQVPVGKQTFQEFLTMH